MGDQGVQGINGAMILQGVQGIMMINGAMIRIISCRGAHGVFSSACWEADRCDREESIGSVTTGPDLIGVLLGLILTRARAPPEEQDQYWRTAADRGSRQAWPIRGARLRQTLLQSTRNIHTTPPHTRTNTYTGNMRNTCARAYCNCTL